MISIGDLDRRVTVRRTSTERNALGERVPDWQAFVSLWAKRIDASDGERRAAAEVGSSITARFIVRSSTESRTITPADRLTHDGESWEITGVKETQDGRRRFLEITAVRDGEQSGQG